MGKESDFPSDPMAIYMTRYAEEIFEPKRVLTDGDWLKSYREPDQRFEYYKNGNGNIKWVSPRKNKVYLFIADSDSFTEEQIGKYLLYATAFFHGMASVEILRAGEKIPGQGNRRIPVDFLDKEVDSRDGWNGKQYRTCGKPGILSKMPTYKPTDGYATLLCTMKDLYP